MKTSITFVLTLLFAFSIFAQKQAEVAVTTTYLRKSADSASERVQIVQKGEKVTIERGKDTNGWFYVSVSNGTIKGWIRKDTVRPLENTEIIKQTAHTNKKNVRQTTQTIISSPTPIVSVTPTIKASPTVSASTVRSSSPSQPAVVSPLPVEDEEILRIETEEISLNVRVVDGNNRWVNNLDQSQFEVYEDDILQPITSFTTAEVPIINALVIDNSRSLRSQLTKVIEAGKIIVGANHPRDESTIVRFVSTDKIEVVQDFTTNKNSLNNALDNLFVEGGQTAIIDAVYQVAKKVEQYQNSDKREDVKLRTLILISDGDDRGSSYNEQQLFDLLRQSNVQIYAVGFVKSLRSESNASGINRQEKAKAFLTRLAQETGGKVYFPDSIDELSQIASDISAELRTQYLITYVPTNENRDGTFRKIKVVTAEGPTKEKRIAITRTGRTSAPK